VIRLVFWLFAAFLALTLMSFVVFAFVSVVAVVILVKLIAWTCHGLSRWATGPRTLPVATRSPVATYVRRPPTPDELLRAEVANIIELRGEGRFITELDEKLATLPGAEQVREPTVRSRHHQHDQTAFATHYHRRHFRAPRPRVSAPASAGDGGLVAQLGELEQLWVAGTLSEEEFSLAKARLLRG
jgi:hypothetical protein